MDIPLMPPLNPRSAPHSIELPPDLDPKLRELWTKSFVVPRVQEEAATLVRDKISHRLSIINMHSGGPDGSEPDRETSPGEELVGTIHTHPYPSGATASFDAADAAEFLRSRDLVKIVLSGNRQFMLMRTVEARGLISPEIKRSFDDARAKLAKDRVLGIAFAPDPLLKGSQVETRAIAEVFRLAYYEGQDGHLRRVVPR